MELFIVRHGIAEDVSADGSDAGRALTPRGRRRLEKSARALDRLGVAFDRVLFSPLLRAQETAEILMCLCDEDEGCESEVVLDLAQPPGPELIARLARANVERIALVGHEPWLSQLAAWLVCGWRVFDEGTSAGVFDLGKGGVLHLSGDPTPGAMALTAAYPPDALVAMA
jgi:phosphohistidine phosphatase